MTDDLRHCAAEAERCRLYGMNETLAPMDRVGATIGELDWLSEKLAIEKDYRYPDFWDNAARFAEEARGRVE